MDVPKPVLELFTAFLTDPSPGSYQAVRHAVISADSYGPYSDEPEQAIRFLNRGQLKEAAGVIDGAMGNLLLSPMAHLLLAQVADGLGRDKACQMERAIAAVCLEGILGTGDGSRLRPYVVVRISDEYDVLGALEKEPTRQALCQESGRELDHITCEDGSELWFDITDAKNALRRIMPLEDELDVDGPEAGA